LQTFCRSEGLRVPEAAELIERSERPERSEHAERSMSPAEEALARQALETMAGQYLAQVMARQSDYFEAFLRDELDHLINRVVERVVEQVVERLAERSERSERSEHPERSTALPASASLSKAELMTWLRTLRGSGMSLQQIAAELNTRGIPTLSGKGRWQKGTIGNLLAKVQEPAP
jgi:paraquat-inducible protein B